MKQHRLPLKLQIMAAGVSILMTLGSVAILKSSAQANPDSLSNSDSRGDGIYLYGEAPQPDQIGKGYVLFQQKNQKVVGALYYPRSEYECFTGSRKQSLLDIQAIGAYEANVVELTINLSQLHPIPVISKNEQRILSDCQQITASVLGNPLH
jgi:hypothetical protein